MRGFREQSQEERERVSRDGGNDKRCEEGRSNEYNQRQREQPLGRRKAFRRKTVERPPKFYKAEKRPACVRVSHLKSIHDCLKNELVAGCQFPALIQKSSGQNRGAVHVRGKNAQANIRSQEEEALKGASDRVVLEMMLGSECSGKEE